MAQDGQIETPAMKRHDDDGDDDDGDDDDDDDNLFLHIWYSAHSIIKHVHMFVST